MAKKDGNIILPDETDTSFDREDTILNFRPKIRYIEPEQVDLDDQEVGVTAIEKPTIDSLRDRTQQVISGYRASAALADLAQKRIDSRVSSAGGMQIKLDPVKDHAVVAAMKRRFPDKEDPTVITYDDYRACLDKMNTNSPVPPAVTTADIQSAKNNPNKTGFGGYDNQQGENRAEISSPANSVQPLDLVKFQSAAILAAFALMRPLVKAEDKAEIVQHLLTSKHI
jgi:hypothetical protein